MIRAINRPAFPWFAAEQDRSVLPSWSKKRTLYGRAWNRGGGGGGGGGCLTDPESKNREGGGWSYGVVANENRRVGRDLQINCLPKHRSRYA